MAKSSQNNIDQNQISEQENSSDEILKILSKFVISSQYKLKSNNKLKLNKYVFLNIDIDNLFQYLLWIIFLFFVLIFLMYRFPTNDVIQKIGTLFLYLLVFILFGLLLIMIVNFVATLINDAKSSVNNSIYRLFNCDIDSYFQIIELLGNKFSNKSLKEVEIRIKAVINQRKSNKNSSSKLIPAFSMVIVAVGIYSFGVPNLTQTANKLFGQFLNTSGIIAILAIGWNIYHEILSQDLLIYEQCILILQEAQNIAREKLVHTNNNNNSSIN